MKHTVIAALLGSVVFAAAPVFADVPDFPHLETVGVGEIIAVPDMAEIHVQVVVTEPTAAAAKQASDKAVASFIAKLKKAGLSDKDIQSANINLQPQYLYQQGKTPELTGYQASRSVTVVVRELPMLNGLLDSALNEGINRINNIEFKASNMEALKAQARTAAIKDAQAKAKAVAEGFGEELKGVWQISYMEQQPIRPVMYATARAMNDGVGESYQNAQITVTDRVQVTYKISR
ncbi:oxidative stress defense protein [Shewanella sp. GXUN23E]|uniref:oxidative stress defense protein n=1 Tax=Shewanella sp. GXUN23E TaxID=3422498 RepID=UPI003D7E2BBD